jgi:hypothetical protein
MAEVNQCSILVEPSKKRIKLDLDSSLEQKEMPEQKEIPEQEKTKVKKITNPEHFTFSDEHIEASASKH